MQLTTIDIVLVIGLILSIGTIIILYSKVSKTIQNYRQLIKDVRGKNLEELLEQHLKHIDANDKKIDHLANDLKKFISSSRTHFQKIGFKRFNPFHETGGDQSFILVLLDQKNNGVLISSLHQREVTRVYGKQIKEGKCKQKLSTEENDVLNNTLS